MSNKSLLQYILLFAVLTCGQGVVFDNMVIFNCAVPFVFIYLIISLPINLSVNYALTAGFFAGLIVDMFNDTYGMNALSSTVLAFVRRPVFHLYMSRDEDMSLQTLTSRQVGLPVYMKFALTMSLIYCMLFFSIEAFSTHNIGQTLLRIAASTLYTFVIMCAIDSVSSGRREKKL